MSKYFFTIFFLSWFLTISHTQTLIEAVPLRLVKNLIFIEVYVNSGENPLNFMFDTGAGITVIDSDVAERLALAISGESRINTSGRTLLAKESIANKLLIGKNLHLDSISLVMMDLSHLSKYLKHSVDGVIGYDLLSSVIAETNIDQLEMRFFSPGDYNYQGNAKALQLTTLESNLFGVLIEVVPKGQSESVSLNFQIDTGADHYLSFHNKVVKKHQLVNARKKQKHKQGFGADSTITRNIESKVSSLILGGNEWRNIPVMLEVDPINDRKNSLADGLIGQRILLDFIITYDLLKRVVYLERRK